VEAAGRRRGYVQAPTEGVNTFGADRVAAYKVETHFRQRRISLGLSLSKPEGLASRVYTDVAFFSSTYE
jgi:hypothetical protein